MSAGYCPFCFAHDECGGVDEVARLQSEIAAKVDEVARLQSEIAALKSDARVRPIELVQHDSDDWRLTVGVNGQFWALRLPAGAHRDFVAAGIPVRAPVKKCWACNGSGGHVGVGDRRLAWRTCDVCKEKGVEE